MARSKSTVGKSRSVGAHTRNAGSTKCTTCERDANGRIKRDPQRVSPFCTSYLLDVPALLEVMSTWLPILPNMRT